MDNASNNEMMMKELEQLLLARDIPFSAGDRKIMCFAHIVDLSSGRVISALSSQVEQGDSDSDSDSSLLDPITHARKVVRAIWGSGMRRDAFEELIGNGNSKGWFKSGQPPKVVQVESLQLLRGVQTRWDSEYYMLNRVHELRPVSHLNPNSLWATLTWLFTGC